MRAPGESLLEKFWETIADKGIGALFRPWQRRREGRVAIELRREEILALAQAEKDAERIRSGEVAYDGSGRLKLLSIDKIGMESEARREPFLDAAALAALCSDIQVAEEVRKQINVTRALLHAEEELEDDAQTPPIDSVNEDWLYRWRDSASQVSTEELQNLWGRVLAGEVKAPGRYSLRTLEFLRNLGKDEAEAIDRLSQFRLGGAIFREAEEILAQEGVNFGFLLSMQQIGIVAGVEAIGLEMTEVSIQSDTFMLPLQSNGMVLVVKGQDPAAKLKLPIYQVTNLGNQVMSLVKFRANITYLRKVGEHIKGQGFEVEMAKCEDAGPNGIRYFATEQL
jgi:hypothetical protein